MGPDTSRAPGRGPAAGSGAGPGQGPALVLVAEDNRTNLLALQHGVQREGHRVVAVENGRQALEALHREPVDIVLLDLVMPVTDGFEVLAAMRADPQLCEIPVLVISAVEDTALIARAIELGAVDVLPKPFDPVILRARLRTGLQQHRLRNLEQEYLRQELTLRQQEKLATLGRLSAGLAHELNNPAAAAMRSAQRLQRLLAGDSGGGLWGAAPIQLEVDRAAAPRPGSLEFADIEEALQAALTHHGIERPWELASDLAAAGVRPEQLATALEAALASAPGGDQSEGLRTVRAGLVRLAARESATAAAAQVATSVGRIFDIVSALRSYSAMDQAPVRAVDIPRGLDDTLTILDHKVPAGVRVVREYAADLPVVPGNGGQLNQVWTNLIDNALHALGPSGRLTLRVLRDGPGVLVQVEDDGPGIPAELQGRVFDPFVTSKEPGEGIGLGLNIAHQIVTEAHGGRLTVSSQPGRTVFSAWLPADGEQGQDREGKGPDARSADPGAPADDPRGRRRSAGP